MPTGSKLDRCHDHVKESLSKKGMNNSQADGLAWGICKKKIDPDDNELDKMAKEIEKDSKKLEKSLKQY